MNGYERKLQILDPQGGVYIFAAVARKESYVGGRPERNACRVPNATSIGVNGMGDLRRDQGERSSSPFRAVTEHSLGALMTSGSKLGLSDVRPEDKIA